MARKFYDDVPPLGYYRTKPQPVRLDFNRPLTKEEMQIEVEFVPYNNPPESEIGEDPTMSRTKLQRSYVLSYSATSILKWMGANGWTVNDARRVMDRLATSPVSQGNIETGLNDGRSEVYRKGMANPSVSEIAKLCHARDSSEWEHPANDGWEEVENEEEEEEESTPPPAPRNDEIQTLRKRVTELENAVDQYNQDLDDLKKRTPKKVHITIETKTQTIEIKEYTHPILPQIIFHLECGDNVMLVGPKGCGKTTVCEQVAKVLKRDYSTISLSGGVTESKLFGRLTPNITTGKSEYHDTPFVKSAEFGGLFLLDEVDNGDPNVLTSLNMVMANRRLVLDRPKKPIVEVHPDFICVAAANTWGNGADRHYVGRNQMDGAFLDRFVQIAMDYDHELEQNLCPDFPDLLQTLHRWRANCRNNRLERVISTRSILRAYNWMLHGKDMQYVETMLFGGWREDEIRKVKGGY